VTRAQWRTHVREAGNKARDGWLRTHRGTRLTVVGIAGTLALVCLAATVSGHYQPASRPAPSPTGRALSPAELAAVRTAAGSCPTLTPARLAGQLMAATTGAAGTPSPGRTEFAGLSDPAWRMWAPAVDAQRSDPAANIVALAHNMCDLIGRVRAAGVPGDPWRAALAAFRTNLAAVVAAGRVPADAVAYVDAAVEYAAWYEHQLLVSGGPGTGSGSVTTSPRPVSSTATGARPTPTTTPGPTPPPRTARPTPTKATTTKATTTKASTTTQATITPSGHVQCRSGNAVVGVWVEVKNGTSGWANWRAEANPARASFTYASIKTGPWQVHVGCGGSPQSWAVATYSIWTSTASASFTCDDVFGDSRYGQCWI
jgi:hypothetical protein